VKGYVPYLLLVVLTIRISPDLESQDLSNEAGLLGSDFYREKFHLFTDRDIYAVNEKVFFRAFHLSKSQLKQANWSKVLYVELIGESNQPIAQGKFELDGKGARGYLTIPPTAVTGQYSLRAYTKWMRNYPPEGYFHKSVVIINPNTGGINNLPVSSGGEYLPVQERTGDRRNAVLCNTDRNEYGSRERISITVTLPERNSASPDGYCMTVVRKGHYETTVPELISPSFREAELPDTIMYYPETRGLSLSGNITTGDGNHPLSFSRVHMTLLGDVTDYYGFMTDETGNFRIALPDHARSKDVLFCVESEHDRTVKFTLDDDYSAAVISNETGASQPKFMDKRTAEEVLFAARINTFFRASPGLDDTVRTVDKPDFSFYGYPTVRFKPSDYVAIPNLQEFFYELIKDVIVRKKKGKPYFRLIGEHPDLSLYDPLVLLDFVPIFDIEQVLSLAPAKVFSIDIINWVYIRGDQRYGGIIHIVTHRGDRAGVELPRNSFFFPFKTCESPEEFAFPDYEMNPADERTPDFRNCLLWIPDLSVTAGEPFRFELFSPDGQGEYTIIVRGISGDGEVVHGECGFTVE
jgi:hypothetical protein